MNTTRVTKIGNSKGVVLPSSVLKALAIEVGDEVQVEYDELSQKLVLTFPHTKQLKLSIK